MSKRAEERASIAAYGWQSDKEGNMTLEMFPEPFRRGFVKGYEQAEKDTIERVCEWWKTHLKGIISDGLIDGILQEFSKAILEEQP